MAAATAMARVHFPSAVDCPIDPSSSSSTAAARSSSSTLPTAAPPSHEELPRPRRNSRRTSVRDASSQASTSSNVAPRPPHRRTSTAEAPAPSSSYGRTSATATPSQLPRPPTATSRMKKLSMAAFGVKGNKEPKSRRDARPSTSHGEGVLGKLASAALSTPELHLASDPLVDVDDAEHRHYAFPSQRRHDDEPSRSSEALPLSGDAAYMSLGAVALQAHDEVEQRPRERHGSNNTTIIRHDTMESDDQDAPQSGPSTPAPQGNWFTRRARKLSAHATATPTKFVPAATASPPATLQAPSMSGGSPGAAAAAPPRPSMSSSLYDSGSDVSLGGDHGSGSGSGFFSDNARNSSLSQMTSPTDWSIHSSAQDSSAGTMQRLRSARNYLYDELTKLTPEEQSQDRSRIAGLAPRQRRGSEASLSRESRDFWDSISNGVLLCLLLNRLMPGAVDKIDRRNVEWVKADNLSRFLRALRDCFSIKTSDLFHPLDLADATVEGLDRAVHTILALQKAARGMGITVRSPSTNERRHSKRRSLIASTPQTPEGTYEDLPSPGETSNPSPTKRRDSAEELTVLQHRQAAEAKLFRNVIPVPAGTSEANGRGRRRRSNDLSAPSTSLPRLKAPSITFDESTITPKASMDDDSSRMPYRDRKMSESALSLTGVAEEEHEEAHPLSRAIEPDSLEVVVDDDSTVDDSPGLGSASQMGGAAIARPRLMAPMAQRRISQEIGIGGSVLSSSPRGIRGSFDGAAMLSTDSLNGSPVRHVPTRRHSARATASGLNPSRDSLLASLGTSPPRTSTDNLLASSRLPFPRPSTTADTANARRMSANLSVDVANPSPKVTPVRPAYRHMRYTSEVSVPISAASLDSFITTPGTPTTFESAERGRLYGNTSGGTPASINATPRPRFDSGVGSIYGGSSTNLLSQEDLATPSSAGAMAKSQARAEAASRHKLVLNEGDKNVTYQMGNCIGRGQFGSVYRALNLTSGQVVAVKRIKLEGRSEEEVTELMNEVDLLKSLVHPSVVKYEGLVRGPDVVSIILEYVENGSLLHTLKAFGNFPEKLVASYVVKILEGLSYLHEQDVVHCDLKAANILTTKNGNVKLSDFGVSLNLKAMEKVQKNDAMGTPNWMAPEVIELKGASTAADIWSLGCTIIELLTGKPPYGDMLAMSALFRIVEDERPPIPEKCSDSLKDFLIQCFQKEPTKRPTAEALFEHDWLLEMWTGSKELRTQDSVPFLRRISLDSRRPDVKKLHAAVLELAEPTDATHLVRPKFEGRSFSTPPHDVWASTAGGSGSGSHTQGTSGEESTSDARHEQHSLVQSPDVAPSREGIPSLDPSVLDLSSPSPDLAPLTPEEETRQHSFVKSTFSKAVRCRICRESVRKHAVLCEDCGLICHASCAREVASPCNLRAQMMLLRQSEVLDKAANTSAAGSTHSTPSSPVLAPPTTLLPAGFRLPFGMGRRSSKTVDAPLETAAATSAEPSPKTTSIPIAKGDTAKSTGGNASNKGSTERGAATGAASADAGIRKRRISLMPAHKFRARSPAPASRPSSPKLEAQPLPSIALAAGAVSSASASASASPSPPPPQQPTAAEIVHARTAPERRASAVSFGSSMSPSSSISSATSHMEVVWQKGQQGGGASSPSLASARRPSLTTTTTAGSTPMTMSASASSASVAGAGGRRGSTTTTTPQQSYSSPVVPTVTTGTGSNSTTATPRPARFKHKASQSLATLGPTRRESHASDEVMRGADEGAPPSGSASASASISVAAGSKTGVVGKEREPAKRNRKTSFAGLGSKASGAGNGTTNSNASAGSGGAKDKDKDDCLVM